MRRDLTLAGAWTQFVLRGLERCGLDVRAICQRCGLAYTELNDPDVRVPRDASGMVWREAARMCQDPLLGLHAAMRMPLGLNNLLAHLVMASPTLLDGLQRVGRYQRVVTHGNVLSLAPRGDTIALVLTRIDGDLPVSHHEIEFMAGTLARLGAFVLADIWRLAAVHFEHSAPPGGNDEHVTAFGCPVHFAMRENALVVPFAVITYPSPHHSPVMMRVLEAEAATLVQRIGAPSMAGEVRARLRNGQRCRSCDVNTIASELHVSVRTLQRRLGEEGLRFSDVRDMARRDLALELLAEGATTEQAARAIGLSGPRALIRATKRWTGIAPNALRGSVPQPGTTPPAGSKARPVRVGRSSRFRNLAPRVTQIGAQRSPKRARRRREPKRGS